MAGFRRTTTAPLVRAGTSIGVPLARALARVPLRFGEGALEVRLGPELYRARMTNVWAIHRLEGRWRYGRLEGAVRVDVTPQAPSVTEIDLALLPPDRGALRGLVRRSRLRAAATVLVRDVRRSLEPPMPARRPRRPVAIPSDGTAEVTG